MAIQSKFLGSVTVTGDDAKAFDRKLKHGRGTKAAAIAAENGRKMVASFTKKGSVAIHLRAAAKASSTVSATMQASSKAAAKTPAKSSAKR